MWLYPAQNVVNIPVICSYTGELICPQMPQNEERNISTDSSSRIVHLQGVLPPNFTIFSSISMIMARDHGFHCTTMGYRSQNLCGSRFPAKK